MQPLRNDKNDVAILTSMSDHIADFKHLLDTTKSGVMDQFYKRYSDLYRYAKVLETNASANQSGAVIVSR